MDTGLRRLSVGDEGSREKTTTLHIDLVRTGGSQ
jgi:hypothetical protein